MKRQELIKVYKDTQRLSKTTTSHDYKKSEKWTTDDLPPDLELFEGAVSQKRDRPSPVNVVNADTLTTAIHLADSPEGYDPLILNMASDFCPGGGVAKGSRAQEEQLFRCTNYCLCTNTSLYPIKDGEFITTDGVTVIKDENYNRLADYYHFDFIAVPALRKPSLVYDQGKGKYSDEDYEIMRDKIESIFRYAIYQEKGSLVLGALGCGAFGNPPEEVRDLFQQAIDKYRSYFDNITFAVLSDDKNNNYKVFKQLQ